MTVMDRSPRLRRLLPFILVMSASCAGITTNAYLMRGATIPGYETYGWGPAASLSTGDPRLDNNEIFDACVRSQVEAELDRRGFERVNGLGMPDLLVHYHASVTQKIDTRARTPPLTCRTTRCTTFRR